VSESSGQPEVATRRSPANLVASLLLAAGDGIRTRDIQLGSTNGPRPADLIALTGLRLRLRVRTSPAGLLSLAQQICVQYAHNYE